jgi:hypothetical protein
MPCGYGELVKGVEQKDVPPGEEGLNAGEELWSYEELDGGG